MKPSQQVADLCRRMGWGMHPHPDVPESQWAQWLEGFSMPQEYGDCPECGGQLQEKSGKYGRFLGCSNYPECRHTEDLAT